MLPACAPLRIPVHELPARLDQAHKLGLSRARIGSRGEMGLERSGFDARLGVSVDILRDVATGTARGGALVWLRATTRRGAYRGGSPCGRGGWSRACVLGPERGLAAVFLRTIRLWWFHGLLRCCCFIALIPLHQSVANLTCRGASAHVARSCRRACAGESRATSNELAAQTSPNFSW